jgi:hypothetical protein
MALKKAQRREGEALLAFFLTPAAPTCKPI